MKEPELIIRRVLELRDPPGKLLLELERLGALAFDEIARKLQQGELDPKQRVNALRRLALLTRQACQERKDDLLELGLRECDSDDSSVRSNAVMLVMTLTALLERFPNHAIRPENKPGAVPSLRSRVGRQVGDAVGRGVDNATARQVQEFLASAAPEAK